MTLDTASTILGRCRSPQPGAAIQLQGSSDGVTWITLYSTTIKGTNGEALASISSNLTARNFQQHRVAIAGSGGPIYCAQLQLSVDNTGANEV